MLSQDVEDVNKINNDKDENIKVVISRDTDESDEYSSPSKPLIKGFSDSAASEFESLLPFSQRGNSKKPKFLMAYFMLLGCSTLVQQSAVFLTIDDLHFHYYHQMRFIVYFQLMIGIIHQLTTIILGFLRHQNLININLLTVCAATGLLLSIPFGVITYIDNGHTFWYMMICQSLMIFLSIFSVPLVFTTGVSINSTATIKAASAQTYAVCLFSIAVCILGRYYQFKKFVLMVAVILFIIQLFTFVAVLILRTLPFVRKRLKRALDDMSSKSSGKKRAVKRRHLISYKSIFKETYMGLICLLLTSGVTYFLYPAYTVLVSHHFVGRYFAIQSVAVILISEQLGRRLIFWTVAGEHKYYVLLLSLLRFLFIPLYFKMGSYSFLQHYITQFMIYLLLGLSHGSINAYWYRYRPTTLNKYEIERYQFLLNVSSALGVFFGSLAFFLASEKIHINTTEGDILPENAENKETKKSEEITEHTETTIEPASNEPANKEEE